MLYIKRLRHALVSENIFGSVGHLSGRGWSTLFVRDAFGLTYSGIKRACKISNLNVKVCTTLQDLFRAFLELRSDSSEAIITDGGLLSFFNEDFAKEMLDEELLNYHAIFLLCQKVNGIFRLFVTDSEGNAYFDFSSQLHDLRNRIGSDHVEIYISRVRRQCKGDFTCYAFALEDARAYQEDGELINELRLCATPHPRQPDHYEMHRLPEKILVEPDEMCRRAVHYQYEMIQSVKCMSALQRECILKASSLSNVDQLNNNTGASYECGKSLL